MKADRRAGVRYARALFALAEESGRVEQIEEELGQTTELVLKHPEIPNLLTHTTISREEKEDFVGKVLPAGFSTLLVNFIKVLVRKKRFQDLFFIREKFHRFYEEKKGLQRVRVESAVPLDEALEARLQQVLERKLNRKVYLETSANPELIGGLVLDFDGTQIDASYRTALQELKQALGKQNTGDRHAKT